MEFGIEKYTLVWMKRGNRQITEGIKVPNQERIIKENYNYLWILEADTIKQVEMNET